MPDKETTALATQSTTAAAVFDASFLPNTADIMEVMEANMEGIDLRFEKVKVPSGGGLSWKVPNEDGGADSINELIGVIIDHHPINAYWAKEYSGEKNPPDCSSLDGITGIDIDLNSKKPCATCPMNQYGTALKGKGKACKNMHRVYLVREGEIFPLLIAVPPTSLENFKQYARRLTAKMRKSSSVLTKLTLAEAKNDGGIEFSKIEFRRAGDLEKESAQKMSEFAKTMKPYLRQIAIDADEYNTEGGNATDGVVNVSDAEYNDAMGFQSTDAGPEDPSKAW